MELECECKWGVNSNVSMYFTDKRSFLCIWHSWKQSQWLPNKAMHIAVYVDVGNSYIYLKSALVLKIRHQNYTIGILGCIEFGIETQFHF